MDGLRENVLKGLGCCIQQGTEDVYCRELDCPYKSESDSCRLTCWIRLLMDAVSLLEAQEPAKPPIANGEDMWECENCGAVVGWMELVAGGMEQTRCNYCSNCGKRVNWDD